MKKIVAFGLGLGIALAPALGDYDDTRNNRELAVSVLPHCRPAPAG